MPAITPDLRERARGCLLGAAVGDAFGMALEGAPMQPVTAQVRELRRGRLPEGSFTANTGSLLTVAEGLLEAGPLSAEDLAARVEAVRTRRSEGAQAGRPSGGFLARALGIQPRAEAPVSEVTSAPDAGVLVRCLPIALTTLDNRFACLALARDVARATHPHPDCTTGAAFAAVLLWHLLQGMAPRQAVQQSLQACSDLTPLLDETIRWASTRLRDTLRNGDEVHQVIESAVWGLLTTASFAEAVTRVTNLGGNAATAGTLIGAWAGAAFRHSGIPADWRGQVYGTWPPRGGRVWREKELVQLAERLVLA